ncbi:hypothetical protein CQW23_35202 [Capsicum baccatum]|uniref:Protein TAR1 n=1 Tax=Capsicum baccatum TaxID=33114 RepID=A0A2G2UWN6_CAPBA|nr:hypothetical protein CQW23_35202 [Capsicum baccatum]
MSDSLVRVSRRVEWGAHRPASGARRYRSMPKVRVPATIEETAFHERIESPIFGSPPQSTLVHAPGRSAYRLVAVPHTTEAHPLDGIHRPIRAAFPNNPTRRQHLVVRQGPGTTELSPSPAPPSRGLGPGPPLRTLLQTTIRTMELPDSKAGLFPIRSSLLRESFAKGSWSLDARRAVAATAKRVDLQPPLAATSVDMDSHLRQPRARAAREASIRLATTTRRVIEARYEGRRDA